MVEDFDLKPIEGESSQVRDKVYERLRQAILKGRIKPGDRLIERKLAGQLGVSRTPVREAIRMLELEGLVSHLPRIGAVAAQVNDLEVFEIYRIRAVLEGLAARMAAEKITPEQLHRLLKLLKAMKDLSAKKDIDSFERLHRDFNDLIYKAADSPRLYSMITTLADHVSRYARVGYARPGRVEEATGEHHQLVEALKLHDGDLAERVAREHIDNSRKAYFSEMAPGLELNIIDRVPDNRE